MDPTAPLELDEALIARKVRVEQSRVLSERLVDSAYTSPLGIGLVAWLIVSVKDLQTALVWVALMAIVEFWTLWVGYRFRFSLNRNASTWRLEQWHVAGAGLMGLGWGSSVWFVWVDGQFLFYLTNLCVLVGVSGICMVVMSPVRYASLVFTAGLLLPPLVQLAVVNNPIALQIGVGWVVMFSVQLWYARALKSELVGDLDSAVRNVALVGLLSQAGRELTVSHEEIKAKNAELNDAMARLNELVTHDQLTGAYSRRYMFEQLERQASIKLRHGSPVALIMFDLDHFKTINDRFGHPVGDRALREVVRAVGAQLRDGDLLGRVGGEEFLVLLPMTGIEPARQLADRLRETLGETTILAGTDSIALPASFGVAELLPGEDASTWFQRVDAALYQAKSLGRNKLVVAD